MVVVMKNVLLNEFRASNLILIPNAAIFVNDRFVDSSDLVVHRDGDYWNVYGHLQAQEVCARI